MPDTLDHAIEVLGQVGAKLSELRWQTGGAPLDLIVEQLDALAQLKADLEQARQLNTEP